MFKQILSNTLFQVAGKMGTALISIFLINILTNYLPIELFGSYGKVYNYLLIFAFLADLGLYTISIREINNNKKDAAKIIGNIMTLRLLLGFIIILISLLIASVLPGYNSQLTMLSIAIVGIFTLFSLINSSILSLMQAYLKMQFSMFSAIFGKLLNLVFIILIIFFIFPKSGNIDYFWPFICIMFAGLVGNITTTLLNYNYAKKIVKLKFHFDKDYIKHIFKISLPYGIAIFLGVVYMKVDIILLSLMEPVKQADISIALYSVPMKIMEVFLMTGTFFLNSILPMLTSDFKKQDLKDAGKTIIKSFKFLFTASVGMLAFGFVFKNKMVEIIANKDYLNRDLYTYTSSDAFIIVLLMIVFYFIFLIFQYIMIASNNQSRLLKINIYITLLNIIGNIIMIPKYSFVGAGIVTVFSQFILMILGYYYTRDIIKINFPKVFILKIIGAGLILYFILLSSGNYLGIT